MRTFTAERIAQDGESSVARWTVDGELLCYCLEPGYTRQPHPIIPAGTYTLRLKTDGLKHAQYLKKFGPDFHKGMIEISGVPARTAIEFHIGNTVHDTLGCSLAGESFIAPPGNGSGHYEVLRSTIAYERVYPILRDAILDSGAQLVIRPAGEFA